MTQILFRCDASLSIGSGHVIRCRTLARKLQLRGAKVLFLCRRQPGDLIDQLEKEFPVLALSAQELTTCDGLEGRKLYEAWLGCSQAKDAQDFIKALASPEINSPDWLVVDHYGLDASWQSQVLNGIDNNSSCKLLVIDDLADRQHQADLLLDQNFFGLAKDQRYKNLVPSHCCQFLGPNYALLAPEYAQLRPLVPMRVQLKRVLVFFGGVDHDNLTARTLKALTSKGLEHLAVDVVLGSQSQHRRAIEKLAAARPNTTIHTALPSLAGLITRADLAIGAGGATTWERACLKLPSLVVTVADNQRPFAEALNEAGHVQLLGNSAEVSEEQIRSALLAQINNPFQGHHYAGGELTDGLGTTRVANAMLGPDKSISLR